MDTRMALVAAGAELAAQEADGDAIEIRAAMKASYRHFMVLDETSQFLGALEGAARTMNDEEVIRLNAEVRLLQGISAIGSGLPVNLAQMMEDGHPEPFGILKLWGDVKEESKKP